MYSVDFLYKALLEMKVYLTKIQLEFGTLC